MNEHNPYSQAPTLQVPGGAIGIDSSGRVFDSEGDALKAVVAGETQLGWSLNHRIALANKMVRRWLEFAEHGTKETK